MDFKDIGVRAVKTAVEVFITALPAGFVFTDANSARVVAVSAALAAGSAFVAVVLNGLLNWAQS